MANILGPDKVKFNDFGKYTLQTDEPVNENTILWTLSTVVSGRPHQIIERRRQVKINFDNRNTSNRDVTVKKACKLNNETPESSSKKIVLLGKTGENAPGNKPKEAKPDTGNKSVVINAPDNRPTDDEQEQEINLKIHVYFDGTFANKDNIRNMEETVKKKVGAKPDIHNPEKIEIDFESDKVKKALEKEELKEVKEKLENKKKELKAQGEDLSIEDKYEVVNAVYMNDVEAVKDEVIQELDQLSFWGKIGDTLDSDTNTGRIGKGVGYFIGPDPTSGMNSYAQTYTNIPIIFDMDTSGEEENTDGVNKNQEKATKEKIIKIYIEGVGTQTGKADDFVALAVGSDSGHTGIPSKVKRAFEEIIKEAKDAEIRNNIITSVEICVIGFSRGSATTRNFVAERSTMLSTLRKINKNIKDKIITYKFVGIFDTVCSVTDFTQNPKIRPDTISMKDLDTYITSLQKNNIKDYKLAMRDNVEEIVHLVAADEHRLFFPLTTIQTSLDAGCGYELVLPGSHCDLGGGDADIQTENFTQTIAAFEKKFSLAKYLMDEQWYPETEPEIYGVGSLALSLKYNLVRRVTVGYNRIPLAMMLHYAALLGKIKVKEKDDKDRTKVHKELEPLKERFVNYARNNRKHGRDITPVQIFNKEFTHLRTKYVHLSAVLDFFHDIITEANFAEIKDVARRDILKRPKRAVLSDRSDWDELGVAWEYVIDNTVGKAGELLKDWHRQAEQKIKDITNPRNYLR